MAVVTVKSGAITNRDSVPSVKNNPSSEGGRLRSCVGSVAVTSGDSSGSKYILAQVPSNARINQVLISSDDLGTTTVGKIGLYRTTADGSAAVSDAFFATSFSLKDGALVASDVTHQSGTFSLANAEKPLWQALSLSADPGIMYDIVLTLTAGCDGSGQVVAKIDMAI
jgi:hypothetical protein